MEGSWNKNSSRSITGCKQTSTTYSLQQHHHQLHYLPPSTPLSRESAQNRFQQQLPPCCTKEHHRKYLLPVTIKLYKLTYLWQRDGQQRQGMLRWLQPPFQLCSAPIILSCRSSLSGETISPPYIFHMYGD